MTTKVNQPETETGKRRKICQTFFMLPAPVDAEAFWLQLKNDGMDISLGLVHNTLILLTDYGFAERSRDEQTRISYFRPL